MRLHGRRKGRPLNASRQDAVERGLPLYGLVLPPEGTLFDLKAMFGGAPVTLEIGFGNGEHMVGMAEKEPKSGFIGCEPFLNGYSALLKDVLAKDIANIRVWPDDARPLIDQLPDASIERCFVLFADPWPKKRHASRRFIGPENLPRLARIIKPGGTLIAATDDMTLARHTLWHGTHCDDFEWTAEKAEDWLMPPEDWVPTRYEQKAIKAGRKPCYFTFKRQ